VPVAIRPWSSRGTWHENYRRSTVGEEDEFSHEASEGEFLRFAGSEEALIEAFENGIVAGGDEGGHV